MAVNVTGPDCPGGDVGDMTALNLSPLSANAGSENATSKTDINNLSNLRELAILSPLVIVSMDPITAASNRALIRTLLILKRNAFVLQCLSVSSTQGSIFDLFAREYSHFRHEIAPYADVIRFGTPMTAARL